ncbi:signal peptide peptidase SppA [Henriciella aquimarina]|uniref:signal peptide peptidase SppA n=1 Tax=Henriciella aquimarina TaxID=545261 RepID=UPI00117ACC13|nr:signal peptide peptidase SppA [Henriciella aquimarina]
MKTFFTALGGAILGTLLGAVLLFFIASMVIGGMVNTATSSLAGGNKNPDSMVLSLDLRQDISDQPATQGLAALFGQKGFVNVLNRLDAARTDDRVKGLFIRSSEFSVGSSRAEELRGAIKRLRASGKFVVVHSQGTYGGGPSAMRSIAAADEIVVQPGGDFLPGGVTFETMFFKGLLDKLHVSAQIEQFYEYKNAPNVYKETGYTEPHREAMTALAESVWNASLEDIAADRGLELDATRSALTSGPLSPDRLIETGLADKLGWPEDVMDEVKERGGDDTELVDVLSYTPPSAPLGTPAIAIVGGEGAIVTGGPSGDFFATTADFASDSIAGALLEAGRNDRVKAIVFRVDSPGGSPVASDQVWRAVERVKEMGKPVVVSMGSVAASGGYYVSTGADWIMASRSTITGSIGIFGGKLAIADGLRQIGVNTEEISVGGPFAGAMTTIDAFTETQREMLHAWLERGYNRFIGLVAEGRGMSVQEVQSIARGRVWSGEDALDVGLVDEIGGFIEAIGKARDMAGIEADEETRLVFYPMAESGIPGFGPMAEASTDDLQTLARAAALLDDKRIQALIEQGTALDRSPVQARGPMLIEK